MKKIILSLSTVLLSIALFTSCDKDDTPDLQPVITSNGAFVACSGNMKSKIPGSISYWDYATNAVSENIFTKANGRLLGGTVNDGVSYGSKIYYVVSDESTIEVVDRNQKSVKQIKTTDLLGAADGKKPRHIIAGDGAVWVTTYGGYVAAIDTTTFTLRKSYKVGSYPEGLTAANNFIYVANSDWGNGNGSISKINLATDEVKEFKIEGIKNPQAIYVNPTGVYVLDWGSYDASYNQLGAGLKILKTKNGKDIAEDVVPNATLVSYYRGSFYTVNAPYGAPTVSYSIYDPFKNATSSMTYKYDATKFSPSAIAVDPVSGHIFISFYERIGGRLSYSTAGYLKEFDASGNELHSTKVGVGPATIFFNTKVDWK